MLVLCVYIITLVGCIYLSTLSRFKRIEIISRLWWFLHSGPQMRRATFISRIFLNRRENFFIFSMPWKNIFFARRFLLDSSQFRLFVEAFSRVAQKTFDSLFILVPFHFGCKEEKTSPGFFFYFLFFSVDEMFWKFTTRATQPRLGAVLLYYIVALVVAAMTKLVFILPATAAAAVRFIPTVFVTRSIV